MSESEPLLKAYVEHGDEGAFRDIVDRYSPLVYSTALRQVGDPHAAEDITQQVFTHLAQQARALPANVVLGGWLYRDAVFTASKYRRSLARQRIREEEAARMNAQNLGNNDAPWIQIAPLLEEAMTRLGNSDRDAIVLRFFEGQAFRSVGTALGITEDAARMRVERALAKLRQFFVSRGMAISATGLAAMLATDAIGSVPAGTMMSIAANALHHAQVVTPPASLSSWFASQAFKFGLAGVLLVSLVTGFIWQSQLRSQRTTAPRPAENPSVQIKGGIRRTTSNPPSMAFYSFKAIDGQPGEEVAVTNVSSNYRLVARTTVTADQVRIEASLFENASDPSAPAIRFPTVIATNGQKSVVSSGIYSFEFTTTLASPGR